MEESPLEMKQLFFNNLQLLGFDVVSMEATSHIPFNKNMFDLPNKHGAEIILHFLFEKLNPTMCREAFRDIWPILDKKREQAFRKTCTTWLGNISQEEPDSHLPRINASLFLSPGGDKFYQLLMHFSAYVLQKILDTELASKSAERLKYPSLSSQNAQLGEAMLKGLLCSSVRLRKNYFDVTQLTLKVGKTWKDATDEDVKEYRKLSKEIRELDYETREEERRAIENSTVRGSPTKHYGKFDNLDPNFDPRTIQRAQRVQYVRDMWKQLDDFERTEAAEREIVESIVERTINKYKIDAGEIPVKVPDMLLRECGEEIRKRNVSNTYQGGRLNLESVLQLWNLSLHLYLEKLKQVGMPKFDADVKNLTSQVHVHQNYLQNAKTLRSQMTERIPVLKESIEALREKLDNIMFKDETPKAIRTTCLGVGLVEPSPQPNFSPGSAVTPDQQLEVPRSQTHVDTPDAANKIMEDMKEQANIKLGPKQLFTGDIELFTLQGSRESAIPRPGSSKGPSQSSSRQSSRPTSARSTSSAKGSKRSNQSSVRSHQEPSTPRDKERIFPTVSSPRTMVERISQDEDKKLDLSLDSNPLSARSNASSSKSLSARSDKSGNSSSTAKASQSPRSEKSHSSGRLSARSYDSFNAKASQSPRSVNSQSSGRLSARSHDSELRVPSQLQGRKTPTDLLVDEIMGEGKILSPFNSGLEAFESRNMINRTPELEEENKENVTPGRELDNLHDTNSNNWNDGKVDDPSNQPDGDTNNQTDGLTEEQKTFNNLEDEVEFEDILGPELEEEYDNDVNLSRGSQRSGEHIIVIDKSLHVSPKHTPAKQQRSEDTDYHLDEERFPSLETSPREAIVIDHSFHLSPSSKDQENRSNSRVLSQSFQGQTVSRDQVTRDLLSKSLILERSPLSQEIRQMFQKAAAETPPRPHSRSFTVQGQEGLTDISKRRIDISAPEPLEYEDGMGSEDDLDLPNMDIDSRQAVPSTMVLKKGDISWDLTENLEDIEMPDFGADKCFDDDDDDNVNVNNNDISGDQSKELNDSDKDADTEKKDESFKIPDIQDVEEIDDFFMTKTPELPARFQGRVNRSVDNSDGQDLRDVDGIKTEIDKFSNGSVEEDVKLISFTP